MKPEESRVSHCAAIRHQLAAYMRAIRMANLDMMADVFTEDAIIDYSAIGGTRSAWPETRRFLASQLDGVHLFQLHVGDVFIDFADDHRSARVETTWHGVFIERVDAEALIVYGCYEDRFRLTVDGWKISERVDRPSVQIPLAIPA